MQENTILYECLLCLCANQHSRPTDASQIIHGISEIVISCATPQTAACGGHIYVGYITADMKSSKNGWTLRAGGSEW